MDSQLINEKQAAEVLSVGVKTLQAWRFRGCGPLYVKLGRAVRYRKGDLEEFIASGIVEPPKSPSTTA